MEHKDDLVGINADIEGMCSTVEGVMGEVVVKVKDILQFKNKKHLLEMNRLTQTQQAEVISTKSVWEMGRQSLLDKLRKVEEELVLVKDENNLLVKLVMQADIYHGSQEGGGEESSERMDTKAISNFKTAKNDDIAEKLLSFVNFPEDKMEMMVEMGGGGLVGSEVRSGEEMAREFLKLTKFPKDMLEEMVEQFIQAEDGSVI